MPRQLHLADTLFDGGCDVVEIAGWEETGSSYFFPVGIVDHHTASSSPLTRLLKYGRGKSKTAAALAGPLCNYSPQKDGKVHVIAAGRANHAGSSIWSNPLREFGATSNRHVYGSECVNLGNGKDRWTVAQLDAMAAADAALCRFHGWPERSLRVCDHQEWAGSRKIDCRFGVPDITFEAHRQAVERALGTTPAGSGEEAMDAKQFDIMLAMVEEPVFIEQCYKALLGESRTVQPQEMAGWRKWLAQPGNTRTGMWTWVENGPERAELIKAGKI